jgi:hypothetical protein
MTRVDTSKFSSDDIRSGFKIRHRRQDDKDTSFQELTGGSVTQITAYTARGRALLVLMD